MVDNKERVMLLDDTPIAKERPKTVIDSLYSLINNKDLFKSFNIYKTDSGYSLSFTSNVILDNNLFALLENLKVLKFNGIIPGDYNMCSYSINPDDLYKLYNHIPHYKRLLTLFQNKSFDRVIDLQKLIEDNGYLCSFPRYMFYYGSKTQRRAGRCVCIESKDGNFTYILPYFGFTSYILQDNKMFKNIVKTVSLLYVKDSEYPFISYYDDNEGKKVTERERTVMKDKAEKLWQENFDKCVEKVLQWQQGENTNG